MAAFILLAAVAFQRMLAGQGAAPLFSSLLALALLYQAFATWRSGVTVDGEAVVVRNRYRTMTVPLLSVQRLEVRRGWRGRSLVVRSADGQVAASAVYFGETDDEIRTKLPPELAGLLATQPPTALS